MEAITLEVEERAVGKAAARAVRRTGNVPCILYGHATEPIPFQLAEDALKRLIFTAETHIVHVTLQGQSFRCILKMADLHPVTDRPMHADFVVLRTGEVLSLVVPIHFEGTPVGQKEGGQMQVLLHEIEIRCLPKDIPSHIEVDVSGLAVGQSIHVGDLSMEGIEFHGHPERTVVTVAAARVVQSEESESGQGEEPSAHGEQEEA